MVAVARPTAADRIKAANWFQAREFGAFSCWSCWPGTGTCRCPRGDACGSPAKHPISPKGFKDATTDPARIATMLSAASEPNYGLVPPDGVLVLDVDGAGLAQLADLQERWGPLPPTLTTQTPNGLHLYLRWPDGLARPVRVFDFVTRWGQGDGAGYVIGPRSVHATGAVYAPLPGAPLQVASLPTGWASAALRAVTGAHRGNGAAGAHLPPVGAGYVLPDRVPEGGRYDAIVSYTAHLYNRGLSVAEMLPLVRDQLAGRFSVPLSDAELRERFGRATAHMSERLGAPRGRGADVAQGDDGGGGDQLSWLAPTDDEAFPAEPDPVAWGGALGELAEAMAWDTDASRVGLLAATLAVAGALLPRMATWHTLHTSSPYVCLVGQSAVGRKGTAMRRALATLGQVLGADGVGRAVLDGVASGEGLISALHRAQARAREDIANNRNGVVAHVVLEEEFGRVLAVRKREGATLDPVLRMAFDGGPLSNHRADTHKVVEPPYWLPALVAITPTELRAQIEGASLTNGSGNRWLYVPVQRRTLATVAQGNPVQVDVALTRALALAQAEARVQAYEPLPVAADVRRVLSEYGDWLAGVAQGLAADLVTRLPAQALRLALVHAAADRAAAVERVHLERGLALTEYARRGLGYVFGPVVGDSRSRLLLRDLYDAGGRLSWRAAGQRIRDAERRQEAADVLYRLGLARAERVVTGGRPRIDLVLIAPVGGSRGDYRPDWQGPVPGTGYRAADSDTGYRAPDSDTGQRAPDTHCVGAHRDLHSFPPPRSSALTRAGVAPPSWDPLSLVWTMPQKGPDAGTPTTRTEAPPESPGASTGTGTDDAAQKVHISHTKATQKPHVSVPKGDDIEPMVKRGDGSVYCYWYTSHRSEHRDIATDWPWCTICSPVEVVTT